MRTHRAQPAAALVAVTPPRVTRGRARGTRPDDPIQEAAAALWALFDVAYSRAGARADLVDASRCTVAVPSPVERRYRRIDTRGETRSVGVSLLLSMTAGHLHGGGLINTSRPYVSFFVAPVARSGQVRWRVGTSGRLLTADFIEDLFLSIFFDDEAATRRLAPLIAYSLG